MSQDEAQKRVDAVVAQMKQDATQAADTARKAAAYLSFWTFMSLLFGAVCATLGGVLGGDLRDEFANQQA
jgi:F0F1-type ATP synthase assembly protein I